MKRNSPKINSGFLVPGTLIAGFTALTMLILLVVLPFSCVSGLWPGFGAKPGISYLAGSGKVFPQAIHPLGTRPAHLSTDPASSVPNQQAITQALWAPGIDHGYVPQGLAFADGQVLVSGYRSTSPVVSMGACRVYRIDPDSGEITGFFDLPPACGHAGGLAYAGSGVLILSDTHRLYRINLERALLEQHAQNAITGTLELGGALRGSFAAFVPATASPGLFIGTWSTSSSKAEGYFLPLSLFDSHDGSGITEKNATGSLDLKARAQGGSFAPDGRLWLSYSSHDFGRLEQLDAASGKVLSSHELVSGTEDISFDDQGGLWAVSEAGSLRWRSWRTSFPVVFRLDTSLLD